MMRRLLKAAVLALLIPPAIALSPERPPWRLIPPAFYPVINAPFTATVETVSVNRFPDGSTARRRILSHVLRDSQGRQRFEEDSHDDDPPSLKRSRVVEIVDPVARNVITLNTAAQTARVAPMTPAVEVPASQKPVLFQPGGPHADTHNRPKRLVLETKMILGMPATGTRTLYPIADSSTIRDAVVVDELWLSTDYRMPLMHIHIDPRTGEVTSQVIEFNAYEPDPSLLTVPSGYTIQP